MQISNIHTVCAWCPMSGKEQKVLQQGDESKPWSHGICSECEHDLLCGLTKKVKTYYGRD